MKELGEGGGERGQISHEEINESLANGETQFRF